MEIRHINENDNYQEIRDIYEKSWQFAYKGIIPQDYLDNIPKSKWGGNILKNGRTEIAAFDNGRAVGTASFCSSRWEKFASCGEIVTIYLLPEYMGKGIGAMLLKECIDELELLGFTTILIWVLEDNFRARRFYEEHGFIKTEEYMNDVIGGKELREVMYLRRK